MIDPTIEAMRMTSEPPERPASPLAAAAGRRRVPWLVGGVVAAGVLVAVALGWRHQQARRAATTADEQPGENSRWNDPRLSYQGPFRNIHPGVEYVGDAACADCHAEIARTYRNHPMGRSLVPVAQAARLPDDPGHHNPFEVFNVLLEVGQQPGRMWHRQSKRDGQGKAIYEFAHAVDFVIGSGARGHSYLSLHEGYVFQTPISWFSQKQVWDLSPGFAPWARPGRLVQGACLYCHVNRVEPVANTRNQYQTPVFRGHAIGCERCHGPGQRHAQSADRQDIVHPGRLEPSLREAVCQQCHLEGATRVLRRGRKLNDFRPGMPLDEFFTVFVHDTANGADNRAVSRVEQMHQSKCFQGSSGSKQMGCVSCHNPHEVVAAQRRVARYRNRCLSCHDSSPGCGIPEATRRRQNPQDSCIDCHMPHLATSDVAHTASTDHRIIRKSVQGPTTHQGTRAIGPIRDFFHGAADLSDRSLARDVGMAQYQMTLAGQPLPAADGELASNLLRGAIRDDPDDLDAREALGKILQTMQRTSSAVDAFEKLLQRAPRHEGALVSLGAILRDQRRDEQALACWAKAVEVNPWVAEYRRNLVLLLAQRNAWDELRPHAEKWLELDPFSTEARRVWVRWLLVGGRRAEAQAEFAKLKALRPPDLDKLQAWFDQQVR